MLILTITWLAAFACAFYSRVFADLVTRSARAMHATAISNRRIVVKGRDTDAESMLAGPLAF